MKSKVKVIGEGMYDWIAVTHSYSWYARLGEAFATKRIACLSRLHPTGNQSPTTPPKSTEYGTPSIEYLLVTGLESGSTRKFQI